MNRYIELPISPEWWQKKLRWLATAPSYLLDGYRLHTGRVHLPRDENSFSQELSRFTSLLLSCPQAKRQAFLMISHRGNSYFPVENMSTLIQKGTCAFEVDNKWMRTPYYVGNSNWIWIWICSSWARAKCTIPDCSASEKKEFSFMEIFCLSWKPVLGITTYTEERSKTDIKKGEPFHICK